MTDAPLLEGSAPLGLLVGGLLLVGAIALAYRRDNAALALRQACLALGLFVLVYFGFILYSAVRFAFDPIDQRLLSPLYVPLLCLGFIALERLGGWAGRRLGRAWIGQAAAIVIALAWLPYPLTQIQREIDAINSCARCGAWRASPVIAWLKTHPLDGTLYSNTPLPVYMGVPAFGLPSKLDAVASRVPHGRDYYVVWFDERYEDDCYPSGRFCYNTDYSLEELNTAYILEPVAAAADGSVYRLTHKPD